MKIKVSAARAQKDIQRIQRKLNILAQDIKDDAINKVQEITPLGFNYAVNLAPEYTGALKRAMRFEMGDTQGLIISSQPVGDIIPTHVLFDVGSYPNPRVPGTLGFMKKTAMFLQQEFGNRMKMAISHSIQKVGGKV